jgi:DNA-binding CsgD family transcriptional regulator
MLLRHFMPSLLSERAFYPRARAGNTPLGTSTYPRGPQVTARLTVREYFWEEGARDPRVECEAATTVTAPGSVQLLGREVECAAIDGLLDAARGGASGALRLCGEPGIGKTALLDYAVDAASDMRVLRGRGSDSELGFRYAGLRQLLQPVLGEVADLPEPQRDALSSSLGLTAQTSPDNFLVGLAVLSLLSGTGSAGPLLCAIDDGQWLDEPSARILAFVAARLDNEGIALLMASDRDGDSPLGGLPTLQVAGLGVEAARALLASAISVPLDGLVQATIVSELGGNPLALLQLPGELSPAQLAGNASLPEQLPIGRRLQESYLRRVHELPPETQLLLLVASAEPGGDRALLQRAADYLGVSAGAVASVDASGLLEEGNELTFRHTFVRGAVDGAAAPAELRRVHEALAAATDWGAAPDRRAWHRGAAVSGPDEEIAAELEGVADQAIELRGYSAAAALLERAAELSPDEADAAARRLVAARAELTAGAPRRAAALLELAAPKLDGEFHRAQALSLRGSLALALGENGHTSGMLLRAAKAFEPFDVRLARETYLEAITAAFYGGRLAKRGALLEAARAAQTAPRVENEHEQAADLLLDGLAGLVLDGHAAAAPTLSRGIELMRESGDLRWLGLAGHAASELWDDEAMHALSTRRVRLARETGALMVLPNALSQLGGYELLVGRFDAADSCFEEARSISASTGNPGIVGRVDLGAVLVGAWRGEEQTQSKAQAHARDATARGVGVLANVAFLAVAVLENGLGHYGAALAAAQEAADGNPFWVATRILPELIEAAVRTDEREAAQLGVAQLAATVLPAGTEWGLGLLARCRALVTQDDDAEELHRDAIDHLRRSRAVPELARARLLLGEWLRRRGQRKKAREELSLAYDMFDSVGAGAFAGRAATELAATGARVRTRTSESIDVLTPHEARIARLAMEGASNPEIAAQLFISPRTVEYHLHKIFRKLGISSRTQLARALDSLQD